MKCANWFSPASGLAVLLCSTVLMAQAAPAPQPLVITKGGTYSGTYSTVTVAAPLNDNVIVDHAKFGNLAVNDPCNITITNCQSIPGEATYWIVVWRFQNLRIEHNHEDGGYGILFRDFSGKAQSAYVRYNKGDNISGQTGPTTRDKCSFIQAAMLHLSPLEIAWNHVQNVRGQSAIEDPISLMCSGGVANSPALMHDNFVDGAFEWPVITAANHATFSGSGCMCFDPGAAATVTDGGYSHIYNNIVIDSENQAFPMAGGHNIEIDHNLAVKDGSGSTFGTIGYEIWNWDNKTPADLFGKNVNIHDNESNWLVGGKRRDWSIPGNIKQSNNTSTNMTEAQARELWVQRVAEAKVVIGPVPLPTSQPSTQPAQ